MNTKGAGRHHWLCTLFCAWIIGVAHAQTPGDPELPLLVLHTARQFGEGVLPRQVPWQGLYCKGLTCVIRSASVRISTDKALNVLDEYERFDKLSTAGDPVSLFPASRLRPGPVKTWYRPPESGDEDGSGQLRSQGTWHMPWGARPLKISRVKESENTVRYEISDGVATQPLFRAALEGSNGEDWTPIIHWVGDLDRDGKSDLLIIIHPDVCMFDERLYLSSKTAEGDVLRLAARLESGEVPCGC